MKRINKICKCGKKFKIFPYRINTAIYCSIKCLRKLRKYDQNTGKKRPNIALSKMGNKNPMFGKIKKNPTIVALHQYLRKYKKIVENCELCHKKKKLELACKNGKYIRDEDEFFWICYKCHSVYDGYDKYLKLGRLKGKKFSNEAKKNMSLAHKGHIPWNKGKKGLQVAWNKGLKKL